MIRNICKNCGKPIHLARKEDCNYEENIGEWTHTETEVPHHFTCGDYSTLLEKIIVNKYYPPMAAPISNPLDISCDS